MPVGSVSALAALLVTAWGSLSPSLAPSPPARSPLPSPSPLPGPSPAAVASGGNPLDFGAQVRALARVVVCAPGAEVPARFDARLVDSHCKAFAVLTAQWSKRWLSRARPFFEQVVPAAEVRQRVVYPFGGGDLLTALAVFPNASEITTLSLEPAGDPRALDRLAPAELPATLLEVRKKVSQIFFVGHSKTTEMGKLAKRKLPGDLTYALAALAINALDVVSVRFFRFGPGGEPVYLSQQDVDLADAAAAGANPTGRRSPFSNVEIEFQARARSAGGRQMFRHITANLDDAHMEADPSVLRHLEAKGPVLAITKAASYLLWWKEFSKIRNYLLQNMIWMISDSTGIPTDEARAAGFEQIPFGHFEGPFLGRINRPTEEFRKLWSEGAGALKFRFGYPDSAGHDHLMITRRATQK